MYSAETVDITLAKLETSRIGLGMEEAGKRIKQYGYNELPERRKSYILMFFRQFHSVLVYILLAALALSIALPFYEEGGAMSLGDFLDAIAIGIILVINAVLGFVQESKAENAIASLKRLSEPMVRVRRAGKVRMAQSRELVPGDIMLLDEGDRVSADGRVIFARNAAVNEASLTGESAAVRKHTDALPNVSAIADMGNMVFKGTVVTAGTMEACVTGTGLNTELGKVASLVASTEHPPTPLERSMDDLGKWLGITVIAFCAVIFVVGIWRGFQIAEILLASASLAVAAVPEGLPAIVTVCLAIGVQRMVGRKALTRKLRAIETLGSVTVICTDKTGTITENNMSVEKIEVFGGAGTSSPDSRKMLVLQIAASCNNAHSADIGDPTETGLLRAAMDAGVERLEIENEIAPFSSDTKYMATSHALHGKHVTYWKGAPEVIAAMCDMGDDERGEILRKNEDMANEALRVLATAVSDEKGEKPEFAGLVGLMDPPRKGVKEAVALAKRAGIRTVMITGDQILTAEAVARRIGIGGEAVSGSGLSEMSDKELYARVESASVFARVTPSQKVRILEALQSHDEIVAMGGDGVNDAPALKKAHVGFAMGMQGTDVARDTADMILTNDHYASVVSAIEEGRTIYDNIRKFVVYLLRANFGELAIIFVAIVIGLPLPLLPIHLLLINLTTDGLPALALAMERPEPDVMGRPPRNAGEHILHGETAFILSAGILFVIAELHVFFRGMATSGGDVEFARTMAFTSAILFELLLVFTCRSRRSLFSIGIFSNRYLIGAVGISFLLMLAAMYTPASQLFHVLPLSLAQWALPVAWGVGALLFFESLKLFR